MIILNMTSFYAHYAGSGEFQPSNSAVVSAVIDEMKKILDQKVRDIEDQINF